MIRTTLAVRGAVLLAAIGSVAGFESRCISQDRKAWTAPKSAEKPQQSAAEHIVEQRQLFQSQVLITAKPSTWIVNPADPPRIVWRDADQVRRLGCDGRLRVRWFDADLREAEVPNAPGRWGAWIEGMCADAKAQIDTVCRAWAEDTGEPFVTLVARRGVIVTHEAFGQGSDRRPISLDYRCWLASITKTITALLFSRFVADHGYTKTEGIGLHWLRHPKPEAEHGSQPSEDTLFSPQTVRHGSFSGCIFMIDLEQQLVITQVRKRQGPRNGEWSARFFQTIARCIEKP